MTKRYLAGVVAVAASISLAACGSSDTSPVVPTSNNETTVASLTGEPVAPPVDDTEAPRGSAEHEPADISQPEQEVTPHVTDTSEVTEQAPPVKPAPEPNDEVAPPKQGGDAGSLVPEMTLASSTVPPEWYVDVETSSVPGEFTSGVCRSDLHYYPVRTMDAVKDAAARFEVRSDGILITMGNDDTVYPHGFIVNVSPTTAQVYTVSQGSATYFIPNVELGQNPELTKQHASELGMCASQTVN